MNRYLELLQEEHRRLNRLIDNCRSAVLQNDIRVLKRLRLRIKDKITQLQRGTGQTVH